ncbi:nuclear transport factor 2 family protein [Svornostia abyssi]|uniref:Nuclear transport factor 2 family protein n=1 Tax=Svornostia abyssi TaxID=2898438 RepID=A0ABY5PB91_9ACTN|nr:nuclear transport factor 2 family protein [Parviterribacteraceae bacterium J379]
MLWTGFLREDADPAEPVRVVFVAADDQAAKEKVATLVRDMRFVAFDNGTLADARLRQLEDTPAWNRRLDVEQARSLFPDAPDSIDAGRVPHAAIGDVITAFLDALANRDFDAWGALWDRDGVMEFPYDPPGLPKTIRGRDAAVAYFRNALAAFGPFSFTVTDVHVAGDRRAVAEFVGTAELLATGRTYEQHYIAVFELGEAGLVGYREYRDADAYRRAALTE